MKLIRLLNIALLAGLFASLSQAQTTETLPATDMNVVRFWYGLADKTPDFVAIAKQSNSYQRANQFDQQDILNRLSSGFRDTFTQGFNGNELLQVNLGLTLENYDFDRNGFALQAFDGNTYIPITSPTLVVDRDRAKLDESKYRLVFQDPQPFSFMPLDVQAAKTLFAGSRRVNADLLITLQPVIAQQDEVDMGYRKEEMRTLICRIVKVEVVYRKQVLWEKSAGVVDSSELAAMAEEAGKIVDVTPQVIQTFWYRLQDETPDFAIEAAVSDAVRSANRFDQERVMEDETRKAEERFADFIPHAQKLKGSISTQISQYDANKGGFNIAMFSGASFLGDDENRLIFENAEDFAFVPMSPQEADALLDKFGKYPSAVVDFEVQPIMAQSYYRNLPSLMPVRQVVGHLTKVTVMCEDRGQRQVLIDQTLDDMSPGDIAKFKALPLSIDTALAYEGPDIVLTWAKITGEQPRYEYWARNARDFQLAGNEFVQNRILPLLIQQREDVMANYELKPWRMRIGGEISDYDFDKQRFELKRIAFDRLLSYNDGLAEDLFEYGVTRGRKYDLQLTNFADLQYLEIAPAQAEELLTQLGRYRNITLDLLVYPTEGVFEAKWDKPQVRLVKAIITEARLLGNTTYYGGGNISRIYEEKVADAPKDVKKSVEIDEKPHLDPQKVEVQGFKLGMSKSSFEKQAKKSFGKVGPYQGKPDVLRFENGEGESGYGYFDAADKLVYLQYYRTVKGMGHTAEVVESVKKEYGKPFATNKQNIGSKILYTYLYYTDPAELGLSPKDQKVGLWVEVQESNQMRPITQLEINLGRKP